MSSEDTFHHVRDFTFLDFPGGVERDVVLPKVNVLSPEALYTDRWQWLVDWGFLDAGGNFVFTKFMFLQLAAGLCTLLIFLGLAWKVRGGRPAKGRFWNFWEAIVVYLRDNVVRPTIGTGHHHDHGHDDHGEHGHGTHENAQAGEEHYADSDHAPGLGGYVDDNVPAVIAQVGDEDVIAASSHPADRYLPFILTCFFYVLFCNLFGALPFLGSATGNINVTGAFALVVLAFTVWCGSQASGVVGFWASLAPGIDMPFLAKLPIVGMIWVIEFAGLFMKHIVLAIRLFANMMAGHTVLGVLLGFIAIAGQTDSNLLFGGVAAGSVFGQLFVGLLELFVAFLQAYVFSFLATLFVSAAVNPH